MRKNYNFDLDYFIFNDIFSRKKSLFNVVTNAILR